MTIEEKFWILYYRFEVKDEDGCSLDSDLVKGKREATSKAKLSFKINKGTYWVIYSIENEVVSFSS
jgi:hypothetical protein